MQGRMCLGEAITRSAPQPLWTCSVLVLGNENAALAQSWPSELARLMHPTSSSYAMHAAKGVSQLASTRDMTGLLSLFLSQSYQNPCFFCFLVCQDARLVGIVLEQASYTELSPICRESLS